MGKNTILKTTMMGLTPYEGEWTYAQAAHLLRRTTFGPKKEEILAAVDQGMQATVQALLDLQPAPPPVNFNYENDTNVPIGETWVTSPYSPGRPEQQYRNQSLRAWHIKRMVEDTTIQEKMTLFWHNHFGVNANGDPLDRYAFINLLRTYALGDFRALLKEVTISPMMLRFLNGNQNSANSPNENYGRELLELFSIGKGPQIGEGDYSNYTEQDVREMARALTGWRTRNFYPLEQGVLPNSYFQANRHDETNKQLSYHFDDRIIENAGEEEYRVVVDIILEKYEVARYICREFYRWFVYYDITDQEELEVIEPLAQLFFDSNYDVRVVIENLLSSQHFFDTLNRGPFIKNPADYVVSMIRPIGFAGLEPTLEQEYIYYQRLYGRINGMGLNYQAPPSVSGWEAYYQAPVFYRSWINSSTLQDRARSANQIGNNGFN
ncbi:MAG: DUF1800 domain-containing protein, partial [Bacteroidota bacterium]